MIWLEAALAFAITMMVFSTIVSVIIETGHRFTRIREKGLQRLMTQIYEDVIWPRLSNRLDAKEASADDFKEQMTRTRFLPVDKGVAGLKTYLSKIVNAKQLTSLTTLEFIERMAETPAGRSLMSEAQRRGRNYIETFLKDLASKYEDFGEDATEYFKRRARLMSVLVAIGLAFALNVNAVNLFMSLLANKEVRQAVIDQGEAVATKLQEQEATLQKLIKTGVGGEKENFEKIEKNMQQIRETTKNILAAGIPIGWDAAPWNSPAWEEKKSTVNGLLRYAGCAWLLLTWASSVLLSGLLIGLGGPFWFDTFRKLSALTGTVRGFQTPVQQAKEEEQMSHIKSGAKPDQESDMVTIFETAAKACALGGVRGRSLLTPEGKLDQGGIL